MATRSTTTSGKPGLNVRELHNILSGIIAIESEKRIEALASAVAWYEGVIPMVRLRFNADEERSFLRGQKAKNLGVAPGTPNHEREAALIAVLRIYERIVVRFLTVPAVDDYWKKYEEKKGALEAAALKIKAKYGHLMEGLAKAFGAVFGVGFRVDVEATKPRGFTRERQIIYSRDYAEGLRKKLAEEGVYPLILSQVDIAVKAASLVTEPDGTVCVDPDKIVENLGRVGVVLTEILKATPVVADQKRVLPGPDEPKVKAGPVKNIWFRGRIGKIFDVLLECGGTIHVSEIRSRVPEAIDADRLIRFIAERGRETGQWKLRKYQNGWIEFEMGA